MLKILFWYTLGLIFTVLEVTSAYQAWFGHYHWLTIFMVISMINVRAIVIVVQKLRSR